MSVKLIILLSVTFVFCSCKKEEKAPLPSADFFVEIYACSDSICVVKFYDNSENSVTWGWKIDDENVSSLQHFSINLDSGAVYKIELTVKNSDGIVDSKIKNISI